MKKNNNIITACHILPNGKTATVTYDYAEINAELKRRDRKTRHFTREFLRIFAECEANARNNPEIDDSYKKGHVVLYHVWDAVYNTAFYRVESCAYCEFLCIAHAIKEKAIEKAQQEEGAAA